MPDHHHTKVVIIGGGFGGLSTAKGLKSLSGEVLLLDKTNHHLFQPLLYQVATGSLSPRDIAMPIREILCKQRNTVVMMSEVASIDKKNKQVILTSGPAQSYDYLVIAVGARHAYFGHNDWEPLAPGLKTIIDAVIIRERILLSFEKAEQCDSATEAEKYLNFIVIGGGPTGVEIAGAIAEIAFQSVTNEFHRVNLNKTKIILIEAAPRILTTYSEKLSAKAEQSLKKLGVQVMTSSSVLDITTEGVQLDGQFIPSRCVIWGAGNQASPLLKTLDVELDRQGRVIVSPDLSIPDHPEVFVIGDAACCMGADGRPIPGIAPAANQQGTYVANIIKKQIPKEKREPFSYHDKGMMATIGKRHAICMIGKIELSGWIAWMAWAFIHIAYLVNFHSRLIVMVEWAFYYFKGQRGARIITSTFEKIFPREKRPEQP